MFYGRLRNLEPVDIPGGNVSKNDNDFNNEHVNPLAEDSDTETDIYLHDIVISETDCEDEVLLINFGKPPAFILQNPEWRRCYLIFYHIIR
ncbi:hypothetical protein Trydic_g23212 [Trypoxylus dichotomus]